MYRFMSSVSHGYKLPSKCNKGCVTNVVKGDNCILTLRDECVYDKNPKSFFFAFQFLLTMPVEV